VCGEPGDGAVLAQQPVINGRHPSVDDVGVSANTGEVRCRDVGEVRVCRRRVELVSLLLQPQLLDKRQRRVGRSLIQQQRMYNSTRFVYAMLTG